MVSDHSRVKEGDFLTKWFLGSDFINLGFALHLKSCPLIRINMRIVDS